MSYDSARELLRRCKKELQQGDKEAQNFVQALEQLTAAVESDMAQIKGALSHVARLLELRQGP